VAIHLETVYEDLRRGFSLMARGASPADVLAQWQSSFDGRWGEHAVEAVKALHQLSEARS
jgi:hypothetical protein